MAEEQKQDVISHVLTAEDLAVHKGLKKLKVGESVEFATEELKAEFLAETAAGPKGATSKTAKTPKVGGAEIPAEVAEKLELAELIVECILTDAERKAIVKANIRKALLG